MSLKRHLVATGVMFVGSGAVFTALVMMNSDPGEPPKMDKPEAVAFEVEKTPPKRERNRVRQEKPVRKPAAAAKLAPAPSLGSALAGISFNLPGFDAQDLAGVGKDMVGATGSAKTMVMTEDAVDKKPTPVKQVAPAFPPKARQRGIEGYVKLNLFITNSGAVEKVKVLEAEPQGVFEDAAIAAAQAWEFSPAEYNGAPVNGWFKRTVSFRLN